jgi:hypothetical protein
MFVEYNANPQAKRVGDCTIRALSKALNKEWDEVYIDVCIEGLMLHDIPSANHVWGDYLEAQGWERFPVAERGYTVSRFAADHKRGAYILAISGHVVACVDGDYFDTWDSGEEVVVYYWRKKNE